MQTPDSFQKIHEILQTKIINNIPEVFKIINTKNKDEIAKNLMNGLFTDEIITELNEIGLEIENYEGFEINIYNLDVTDKDTILKNVEYKDPDLFGQEVKKKVESKDRYCTYAKEEDTVSLRLFDLKNAITTNDVDTISKEDFLKMIK
jgi:predicted transcriptional regulator